MKGGREDARDGWMPRMGGRILRMSREEGRMKGKRGVKEGKKEEKE